MCVLELHQTLGAKEKCVLPHCPYAPLRLLAMELASPRIVGVESLHPQPPVAGELSQRGVLKRAYVPGTPKN